MGGVVMSYQRTRERQSRQNNYNTSELGTVTSSGKEINVLGVGEYREVPLILPFGIVVNIPDETNVELLKNWQYGKNIVSIGNLLDENIKTYDKEEIKDERPALESKLKPGEVMFFSLGGATIKLKNNGDIVLNRRLVVHPDGTTYRIPLSEKGDDF